MSRIDDLGPKLMNLPEILLQYENDFTDIATHLKIKGKMLDVAFHEQAAWPIFYEVRHMELRTLCNYMEAEVKRVRGSLLQHYNDNLAASLSITQINGYIDAHPDYLKMYRLSLELEELRNKYERIADAFKTRGFALRDLTAAKIAEIHNLPA